MTTTRCLRPLALIAFLALAAAPGCAAPTQDDAATGDDANLTKLSAADVKTEGANVDFGSSVKYVASPKDKVRIHAVPFNAGAGDVIDAESRSAWGGTLYVLKSVGAGYAVVSSAKADPRKVGKLNVTLKTGGLFFVGFEATAPKTAAKTAVTTVTLKLDGAPKNTDSSFVGKLKAAYDDGSANDDFKTISENDLPAAAKKDWNKLNKTWGPDYPPVASTWTLAGKTIYVVENDNDGGMSITFYDDKGVFVAGGSAGESSDFTWD